MNSIDEILDLDEEIISLTQSHIMRTGDLISNCRYPKTFLSVFTLCARMADIKSGIFQLVETENLYSIKILFRSMIEHFLKHQYLFLRWCKEKSDDPGNEYLLYCNLIEEENIADSYKKQAQFMGHEVDLPSLALVRELHPELAGISDNEVRQKANQFSYRRILRYFSENVFKNNIYTGRPYLLNYLPLYSDLSSFVHGGPIANKSIIENLDPKKEEAEILYFVEVSLSLSSGALLFTLLMFYQEDKSFWDPYNKLNLIMNNNFKADRLEK